LIVRKEVQYLPSNSFKSELEKSDTSQEKAAEEEKKNQPANKEKGL
jgi:hypothetical protein